jgi:cytochrome oxidase Cu insertion factor (SCO1/SenC/PrrC family)
MTNAKLFRSGCLVVAILVLATACGNQSSSALTLPEPKPVTDAVLTDETGQTIALSSFRGHPMVVTFLYTHCTDTCPFVALKFRQLAELLGDEVKNVTLVGITTDPDRDTPAVMTAYSKDTGLWGIWHFLTGPQATLEAVWKDFGIAVARVDAEEIKETAQATQELGLDLGRKSTTVGSPAFGLAKENLVLADRVIARFGGGYELAHSTPFWLVDKQGRRVAALGPDTPPEELAKQVRAMIQN